MQSGPEDVVVAGALDVVLEDRLDMDVMLVADTVELAPDELAVDEPEVDGPPIPVPPDVELSEPEVDEPVVDMSAVVELEAADEL